MLTVEEFNQAKLDAEREYKDASVSLAVNQADTIASSMTGMMGSIVGKQSDAYRAMFAVEKGIAIARSIMNIQTAMSSAAASLPFPANLGAMATVATNVMGIIQNIQAVRMPEMPGYMNGGYTGNLPTNAVAGYTHGQEFVSNAPTTRRYRRELEAMHNGTYDKLTNNQTNVNINIENRTDAKVTQTFDANGDIRLIVADEIDRQLPTQVNDPNSRFNKSLQSNYQIQRKVG